MIPAGELKKKQKQQVEIKDEVTEERLVAPILLGFVLDGSGSMANLVDQTISGFNEYLNSHRDNPMGRFILSTLSGTVRLGTVKPVSEAVALNRTNYRPDGGTPLYDTIKGTIELMDAAKRDEDGVLLVILTDGLNNQGTASKEDVRTMIEERTKGGAWTFVYVGANQDAWAAAADIGVAAGNTMAYNATPSGMSATADSYTQMSQTYRRSAARSFQAGGQSVGASTVNLRSETGIDTCLVCGQKLPTSADIAHVCPGVAKP